MAYHSEVLQKERDMLRRNRLSSPRSAEMESLQEEESESGGMRRAGGGSHRFSVMAEAALAQARTCSSIISVVQRVGKFCVESFHVLPAGTPESKGMAWSLVDGYGAVPVVLITTLLLITNLKRLFRFGLCVMPNLFLTIPDMLFTACE